MSGLSGMQDIQSDNKAGRNADDILEAILCELRGIRLAMVHIATQDKSAMPDDFNVERAEVVSPDNSIDAV